jgi:hypothetical protein
MNRHKYWVYREPSGSGYDQLIEFCASRASKCSFTLQKPHQFERSCYEFLNRLKQHFLGVVEQAAWPGTVLTRSTAPVYWYRVSSELTDQLKARVRRLYAWAHPTSPEDVALYWPDGSVLLGTSSQEQFAFLNLSDRELDEFRQVVVDIRLEKYPPPTLVQ